MFEKKALQPTVSQSLGHCWMPNLCPEKVDPTVLHDFGRFSHQFHWLKHGKIMNNLSKEVCAWQFFSSKTHFLWENTHFSQKKTVFLEKKQTFFLKTPLFLLRKTRFWSNCMVLRCKFGVSLHQTYTSWGVSLHQTYIKLKLVKCKFDVNLRPWSVSLLQTYTGKCKFTSNLHLQV